MRQTRMLVTLTHFFFNKSRQYRKSTIGVMDQLLPKGVETQPQMEESYKMPKFTIRQDKPTQQAHQKITLDRLAQLFKRNVKQSAVEYPFKESQELLTELGGQDMLPSALISLNTILVSYKDGKFAQMLTEEQYSKMKSLLDVLCFKQLKKHQREYSIYDTVHLGPLAALIHSASTLKLGQTCKQIELTIETQERPKQYISKLSMDNSLDLLYLLDGLKHTPTIETMNQKCVEHIIYIRKKGDENSRLSQTFNYIRTKWRRSSEELQAYLQDWFKLELKELMAAGDEALQKMAQTRQMELLRILKAISHIDMVYGKDLCIHSMKIMKLTSVTLEPDHSLLLMTQIITRMQEEFGWQGYPIMFKVEDAVIENFEKLSKTPKLLMQIYYQMFFHWAQFSNKKSYPLLFTIDLQAFNTFDLIQYLYCLRKYQLICQEHFARFGEVYQQLLKSKSQLNLQVSKDRLDTLLRNQKDHFAKRINKQSLLSLDRKLVEEHIGTMNELHQYVDPSAKDFHLDQE